MQNRAFETHRKVVIRIGDDRGDEVDILAEELGELKRVVDRIVRHACVCACMSMCSRQTQRESLLCFLACERAELGIAVSCWLILAVGFASPKTPEGRKAGGE